MILKHKESRHQTYARIVSAIHLGDLGVFFLQGVSLFFQVSAVFWAISFSSLLWGKNQQKGV